MGGAVAYAHGCVTLLLKLLLVHMGVLHWGCGLGTKPNPMQISHGLTFGGDYTR